MGWEATQWPAEPRSGGREKAVRVSTDVGLVVDRSTTWAEWRIAHTGVGGAHGLRLKQVAPNLGGSQRQIYPQAGESHPGRPAVLSCTAVQSSGHLALQRKGLGSAKARPGDKSD